MGNDDDQLTLAQAAVLLGLAPATLRMQVKAGRLGARLTGQTWVTTPADVEAYRRDHLGRRGRPRKPGGLQGLLAAIGQDLAPTPRRRRSQAPSLAPVEGSVRLSWLYPIPAPAPWRGTIR